MKKTLIVFIFMFLFATDLFAASALTDRGEYLKIFWGTSSRHVLNSDCVSEYNPAPCCTGEDAGTCDTVYHYRNNDDCTANGVPYTCCTDEYDGNCEDIYSDDQTVTAGASSVAITGTFNIGTTYYFSSKAYSTKGYGCKSSPCESYYSNETSWVADSTTTVDLEWDKYGYNSYVLYQNGMLNIVFDEAVYTSTDDDDEFDFIGCDDCTITYQSGSGTDTITYLISGTIDRENDSIILWYEPEASIEDGEEVPVDFFGDGILLGTAALPIRLTGSVRLNQGITP